MPSIFPVPLFNPMSITPIQGRRVISGGVALNGVEDLIATDGGGLWALQMSGIELRTPQLRRAWDAWKVELSSGLVECWLPVPNMWTAPKAARQKVSDVYTDDDFFPSVLRYAVPVIVAKVVNAAALRATQMTIEIVQGARLQGGELFSVMHAAGPAIYSLGRVLSRSGQQVTAQTWPPARDDIANGASANFDFPMMRAKLQPGYDMSAAVIAGRYATGELIFVEATS